MCARYTLRTKLNLLLSQFAAETAELELSPRYNIAPTQQVAAVRLNGERRELVSLRWGLIPSWAKEAKIAASLINARADTAAVKPAFRAAFRKRRCLVLADGYYEWLTEGKEKQPFLFELDGGQPFAFAGLWESWRQTPDSPAVETCTILTTEANALAREIHDRMPVVLEAADHDAWLRGGEVPLAGFPEARMTMRPVSRFVNNSRHEGRECLGD